MLRLVAIAVTLCIAQTAYAQETPSPSYCDSACVIPTTAPPECRCGILGGGTTGGGGTPGDRPSTPVEWLEAMQATYERGVADVENYRVVVRPSAAPMPAVLYFEKEIVDGRSIFRQWSTAELAEWQAQQTGRPTPRQMGEGMEALAGALSGALPPGDPPLGRGITGSLISGIRHLGRVLQSTGPFEMREDVGSRLLSSPIFRERARQIGTETLRWSECNDQLPCIGADGHVETTILHADSLQELELGEGSEGYTLKEATVWVFGSIRSGTYGAFAVKYRMILVRGSEHIAVQRTIQQHYRARQMLEPGYIEDALGITPGTVGDWDTFLGQVATRAVIIVMLLQQNEGPPTEEEMARLIHVASGGPMR